MLEEKEESLQNMFEQIAQNKPAKPSEEFQSPSNETSFKKEAEPTWAR